MPQGRFASGAHFFKKMTLPTTEGTSG